MEAEEGMPLKIAEEDEDRMKEFKTRAEMGNIEFGCLIILFRFPVCSQALSS